MTDSATSPRDRRRAETARRLAGIARDWTAERGLAGYTIEELCAEAGVSRRTFFNYFPSKEDAILGIPVDRGDAEAAAEFVARAADAPRAESGLTATLIDDLERLFRARWAIFEHTRDDMRALFAALDREPRLHARILDHLRAAERGDTELIERREGLDPGDPRAATLVSVFGVLNRLVMEEQFAAREDVPFGIDRYTRLLRERIDQLRVILG